MAIRTTASRDGIFVSWSLAFHGAVVRALCAIVFASAPIMAASGEPAAPSVPDRAASHSLASPASGAPDETPARLAPMLARVAERLTQKDIGLVINTADPYSVEVGEFYIQARKLSPDQVLRVELPVKSTLTPDEFQHLRAAIDAHFNGSTQALAMAWTMPYAVSCNAITGALALGFDPMLCVSVTSTCAPSKPSPYFNARTATPYGTFKMRLSMLLAAKDVAGAKRMIERGVASDHTLGLRGAPSTNAYFVVTDDKARSSRSPLFPPSGPLQGTGIEIHTVRAPAIDHVDRLVLYETGATQVGKLDTLGWVPGALADHLTSFAGQLDGKSGQMTALEWIASGATASYGTVSEPCSHQQKFPHPKVLLFNYAQGSTAIEAYWRSVAWPLQGVFVGEPLAAPFARR